MWKEEQEKAFREIKRTLTNAPTPFHEWQQLYLGWHMLYWVCNSNSVIEAHLLPVGTFAQKAELVNLTWALQLTTVQT
jgi:hypothetical protein